MLQSHATPPILPSPARMGLTNPTSPSHLQNPNPNPKPPPSSAAAHHRLSATTTSSTLLPLLPPLSRAQSLLHQMSSLATKLFDVSPKRALWLASFRGSLPSFLSSSTATSQSAPAIDLPSASSTKEVISLFTSLQTQLFESVAELQEILDLQSAKQKLSGEIRSKDATLLSFAKKLIEAETLLDQLVEDYSDYLKNPKRLKHDPKAEKDTAFGTSPLSSSLNLSDILSYAHKISYTTFAPPEFGAGQAPLRGALPPAPQEEQMRASQLYHFVDLDVGVPKKAAESRESATDTLVEAIKEPTPPREEVPPAVVSDMLLSIAVARGWKKGMPVDLPSVPSGWKPGDPISLPPLEGLLGAARGEEQRATAAVPQVPAVQVQPPVRAQEVIQVKAVQLDISSDNDEYSSDYSSEVGSSDEDDED